MDVPDDVLSCTSADESYQRGIGRLAWSHERAPGGAFSLSGAFRAEDSELDDPGGACGFVSPLVTGGRDQAKTSESESTLEAVWVSRPRRLGPIELGGRAVSSLRYARVDASDADVHRRTTVLLSLLPELGIFGRELRLFPALAFERADTSDGLARSAASQPMSPVSPSDENAWLPSVGAIWQIAPGLRAKGNWKRVMRRPTFTDLFHPDWGFIRGNPGLASERGWNADLGFELASAGAGPLRDLRFEADLFQRELDEGIEWVLNVNNAYMPLNTGPSRALGVEIGIGATALRAAAARRVLHLHRRALSRRRRKRRLPERGRADLPARPGARVLALRGAGSRSARAVDGAPLRERGLLPGRPGHARRRRTAGRRGRDPAAGALDAARVSYRWRHALARGVEPDPRAAQ